MAQLNHLAKYGSDWTNDELSAYNISITPTSPANFFQSDPDPSLDHLDPSILTTPATDHGDPNLSEATSAYLGSLEFTTKPDRAIDDFAAATLRLLGFNAPDIIVSSHYPIPLMICGKIRAALTDAFVIYRPNRAFLLVLVGDKPHCNTRVEARVVAAAIAAFQSNNANRAERGQPTLKTMTIPCVTMSGTIPSFYLVPVTKELSDAVIAGQCPASQTQVLKCATTTTHQRQVSDGMVDLEFRRIALKRFLAFKGLAQRHWQNMVQ